MDLIGTSQWENYKNLQSDAHDSFAQQDIIWVQQLGGLDVNGEDNINAITTNITLKALNHYNDPRVWPSNAPSVVGELDEESTVILLNYRYLKTNGYTNANGNFIFNQDTDRFIQKGILYKSGGFTDIAQAQDEPLWVQVILVRDRTETGNDPK